MRGYEPPRPPQKNRNESRASRSTARTRLSGKQWANIIPVSIPVNEDMAQARGLPRGLALPKLKTNGFALLSLETTPRTTPRPPRAANQGEHLLPGHPRGRAHRLRPTRLSPSKGTAYISGHTPRRRKRMSRSGVAFRTTRAEPPPQHEQLINGNGKMKSGTPFLLPV